MQCRSTPKFGVAGNPPRFFSSEYGKERANSPEWLHSIGLDALEIQCTYGVRMPHERIEAFRRNAERFEILLSIHGPYYINIGTNTEKGRARSEDELVKGIALAQALGSTRVIFHPGGIPDTRDQTLKRAMSFLARFASQHDCGDVRLYPETAGKVGQLGSLDDILSLCEVCPVALPCLDLAHLHARTHGSLRSRADFQGVIDEVNRRLGSRAVDNLHVHLYPVQWGDGGEVGHKAFFDSITIDRQGSLFCSPEDVDKRYLPRYEDFLDIVHQMQIRPVIICEAKDSQDLGALEMKSYYQRIALGV